MKFLESLGPLFAPATTVVAFAGEVHIHDPYNLVQSNGKFYTYGTGGTCRVSEDGWTWSRGVRPQSRGMAPDTIHLGDRFLTYVARNVGAQPRADINLIWTTSLDTPSTEAKWEEAGVVVSSDGIEDCSAIDPGLLLDPTNSRLWMVCGSYFGFIRLVELDTRTGLHIDAQAAPVNLAVNCDAAILIHEAGWRYLWSTQGSYGRIDDPAEGKTGHLESAARPCPGRTLGRNTIPRKADKSQRPAATSPTKLWTGKRFSYQHL